mmetsp:Transcript_16212/g.18959  ORF Transcript_16212/g.18959 Transcript_16212/m.18959 type:complete len:82 (-) Transcript_16212:671-916(-)
MGKQSVLHNFDPCMDKTLVIHDKNILFYFLLILWKADKHQLYHKRLLFIKVSDILARIIGFDGLEKISSTFSIGFSIRFYY